MASASAQPRLLLLYDGQCRFCLAGSDQLLRLARPGAIERIDLHDRAALARWPHAPQNPDASTIRLVRPDGRVAEGAEAIMLALNTRPAWRLLTWIYWVPGIRQLYDAGYRWMARNRFRIMGRVNGAAACDNGACRLPNPRPRG